MKKIAYISVPVICVSLLTGCGEEKKAPAVNKPENHATFVVKKIAEGDFERLGKSLYVPKEITDKKSFMNAYKESEKTMKSKIDAGGGIQKIDIKSITVRTSVKLKNFDTPVEIPVSMVKTGPNTYYTIFSGNK